MYSHMGNKEGILEEGECDYSPFRYTHNCCFKTINNHSKINSIGENMIFDKVFSTGVGCDVDICKIHLDYVSHWVDGVHDVKSWKSKLHFYRGVRLGGKNCHLLRIYSWSMAIPILMNLFFSSVIFYMDLKSGASTMYELPFLIFLFYPQWRTFKILVRYFFHKNDEDLTDQLDENDMHASFIEPFCESGLQVSIFLFCTKMICKSKYTSNNKTYVKEKYSILGANNTFYHLHNGSILP